MGHTVAEIAANARESAEIDAALVRRGSERHIHELQRENARLRATCSALHGVLKAVDRVCKPYLD